MSEHAYTARALPRRPDVRRSERHGAISALGVAALCVAGLVIVWTLASQVPVVRVKDAVALHDFTLLSRPARRSAAERPAAPARTGAVRAVGRRARGGRARARAPAGRRSRSSRVMALAPLTAETLKPLLAHPHDQVGAVSIGAASWPSGHSTAALALVLCARARRAARACARWSRRSARRSRWRSAARC